MSVLSFFGTKKQNDGRIKKNIKFYLDKENINYRHIIVPSQFHSTRVEEVTEANYHKFFRCDGLITKEKGIVITIITADCVPIIYKDAIKGIVAISHQGWKGTLHKFPAVIIDKMIELGSDIKDISCEIGPCIDECCYEIYGERKKSFTDAFGTSFFAHHDDKMYLSLRQINIRTIIGCGVLTKHIKSENICTSCSAQQYWSYHRDQDLMGEQFSYVVML